MPMVLLKLAADSTNVLENLERMFLDPLENFTDWTWWSFKYGTWILEAHHIRISVMGDFLVAKAKTTEQLFNFFQFVRALPTMELWKYLTINIRSVKVVGSPCWYSIDLSAWLQS